MFIFSSAIPLFGDFILQQAIYVTAGTFSRPPLLQHAPPHNRIPNQGTFFSCSAAFCAGRSATRHFLFARSLAPTPDRSRIRDIAVTLFHQAPPVKTLNSSRRTYPRCHAGEMSGRTWASWVRQGAKGKEGQLCQRNKNIAVCDRHWFKRLNPVDSS